MKPIFSLLMVFAFVSAIVAQEKSDRLSAYGQLIRVQLSSAPFPHPKRATGYTYGGHFYPAEDHYRDSSVAIFIPNGFRHGDVVDIVVYFHGWWNSIDTTLSRYKLPQQLAESGKNAILVVPEGPCNAPDSFGGKLEDPGGFKRFIKDVVDVMFRQSKIKTRNVGTIILAGHSGGYRVISFVLMRGGIPEKVREVYLFDALYGQLEKYVHWLDTYRGKMITIYTDSSGTKEETEALIADLDGWNVPYLAKEELVLDQDDLLNHRLVFIHTDLGHDAIMLGRHQFQQYLKASCLADR